MSLDSVLSSREKLCELVLRSAPDGLIISDRHGRIVIANPQAAVMFGYADAGIEGLAIEELLPESLRDRHVQHRARFYDQPHPRPMGIGMLLRARRRDGSEFPVEISLSYFHSDDGPLVTSIIRDVADRQRIDQQIRFQAHLLDAVGEAVIATDLDGRVLYWNRFAETLYGWRADEVLNRNIVDVTPTEAAREQAEEIMARLRTGETWSGEFLVRRRDASQFPAMVTDTPILDEQGELVGIIGVSSDLTDRKRLEEQLLQAQKLESLGRLAGGVAHDFNNLMTVVESAAVLALATLSQDHEARADLAEIRDAAERATSLTGQLLAFSRCQIARPAVLNINELLTKADKMLRRVIGEDIELASALAPNLWLTRFDPNQFDQVVMNLAVNARDAMPRGGRLVIETANVVLDPQYANGHAGVTPGEHIMLAITDNGVGMTEDVRQRIFEPFFTTKGNGKGTGLGLATCYGLVQQAGGQIWVYSEPGHGTSFKIYLPRAYDKPMPLPRDIDETIPTGGTETVLVVEDEPAVRRLTVRVLAGFGYTVLEADGGDDALRVFREHTGPIHLVMTDVIMPGMSGSELSARVRELRPETKVLFSSGYTDETIAYHGVLEPSVAFIQKPFSPGALAGRVREVLDQ